MKKLLFVAFVIIFGMMIGMNYHANNDETEVNAQTTTLSDEELMDVYINNVLDDDCYGELLSNEDIGDGYIAFNVYDDVRNGVEYPPLQVIVSREHCQHLYEE